MMIMSGMISALVKPRRAIIEVDFGEFPAVC